MHGVRVRSLGSNPAWVTLCTIMDKSFFLTGLSFPMCTMNQLSQKSKVPPCSDSLWIYSALFTQLNFLGIWNPEAWSSRSGHVFTLRSLRGSPQGKWMMPIKRWEVDGLTLCHEHELNLSLIWNLAVLKCIWSYFFLSAHSPLILMTCPLYWKIHLPFPML